MAARTHTELTTRIPYSFTPASMAGTMAHTVLFVPQRLDERCERTAMCEGMLATNMMLLHLVPLEIMALTARLTEK